MKPSSATVLETGTVLQLTKHTLHVYGLLRIWDSFFRWVHSNCVWTAAMNQTRNTGRLMVITGVKFWDVRICWSCCCCCCCSRRSCFCCSDKRGDLKRKQQQQQQRADVLSLNLSNDDMRFWWYHLSTYGLALLGKANPCARACGLRGGGCGRKAGNVV